jgi:hypothetical protein
MIYRPHDAQQQEIHYTGPLLLPHHYATTVCRLFNWAFRYERSGRAGCDGSRRDSLLSPRQMTLSSDKDASSSAWYIKWSLGKTVWGRHQRPCRAFLVLQYLVDGRQTHFSILVARHNASCGDFSTSFVTIFRIVSLVFYMSGKVMTCLRIK